MNGPINVLELRSVRGTGGGPEKTILLGAAQSDRRRFAVTVTYIRDMRDHVFGIDRAAKRAGVDYVEVRERHSLDWRVVGALRDIVRLRKIDIVHAHDYKTDALALILARTEGVVPLATAHGWTGHSPRERWGYYPLDKQLLRAFPRVIAVAGNIRQDLERAGVKPERILTLLNGIDPAAFHRVHTREAAARQALGVAPEQFVIGAVGRLENQKRFDVLLDACARLTTERPIQIVIAGAGSLQPSLQAQAAQLFPAGNCRLIGHCSDIAAFHHGIDLLVQSSDYEGSPNVVLEAMAFATPVVATTAGGTAELVRDGVDGLLVPPGNPAALARAIDAAIANDHARNARVRSARARIECELSFGARQDALEGVYDELVGRRRPDEKGRAAARWA